MNIPKPKKLPSGNWRIQVQIDGRRYSITDPDQKVVKQKAKELYAGIQLEKRLPLTVGVAFDKYIEAREGVLSPSTVHGYKKIRKHHLQCLMQINISELTQEDVQTAISKEVRNGSSPKTIRNAHGLLSAILKQYRPSFRLSTFLPNKEKYEARIPTEAEIKKIWAEARGTKYEIPILLASWIGLRKSEICGLKYSDFDQKNKMVHVERAIVEGENGPTLKKTKTTAGKRWISCPDEIINLVFAQKHDSEEDYITHLSEYAIYDAFVRICKRAGVPPCRFHDLRHFAASEAHSLGVPDKYQMTRMGHKSDNMLKLIYEHAMRDKQEYFSSVIDDHMSQIFKESQ